MSVRAIVPACLCVRESVSERLCVCWRVRAERDRETERGGGVWGGGGQ